MKMKTLTKLLAMLSITCLSPECRAAELRVSDVVVTNSDSLILALHLESDLMASGVQFSLELPGDGFELVAIEPKNHLADISIHWEMRMDTLNVIILDASGVSPVPPGNQMICQMRFAELTQVTPGIYSVRILQATLVDDSQPTARHRLETRDGRIQVTQNVIALREFSSFVGDTVSVALEMHNVEDVAGIQGSVTWENSSAEFLSAHTSGRAESLTIYTEPLGLNGMNFLISDLQGTSVIRTGGGRVAELKLVILNADWTELFIENLTVSNLEGDRIPAAGRGTRGQTAYRPNTSPDIDIPERVSIMEDEVFLLPLGLTDADEDSLTIQILSSMDWVALSQESIAFRFYPQDQDVGTYELRFQVSDADTLVVASIEVAVLNRPPEFSSLPPQKGRVGARYTYKPEITNLDGGTVHLEAEANEPSPGIDTGYLTWVPQTAGDFRFRMIATDPQGGQAVQEFTVHVASRPSIEITEILADPPSGEAGDVNGDGRRDSKEDEFVELRNRGSESVDLSGWSLSDDDLSSRSSWVFPPGTVLDPEEFILVFGGGEPKGFSVRTFVSAGSIGNGLSNSGDIVLLIDPEKSDTIARASYVTERDLNASFVHLGDGLFVPHDSYPGRTRFSPGRERSVVDTSFLIAPDSLLVGETGQLRLVARYTDSVLVDVIPQEFRVTEEHIARADSKGKLFGLAEGTTEVIVLWNGVMTSTMLSVVRLPLEPPEISGIPPSWTRARALYRFLPKITRLNGGTIRLESRVSNAIVDPRTGAMGWRPTTPGEYLFRLIASNLEGSETILEFTIHVEPRIEIRIVEILADPPTGIPGDANGDGIREGSEDEFIELLNSDENPISIEGWSLSDDDVSMPHRFRFPTGTIIQSGERLVLFGGGKPVKIPGQVFVDDGRIGNGLTNSNERVLLIDPVIMDTVDLAEYQVEGDLNQSLIMQADQWIGHNDPPGIDLYSPGSERGIEPVPAEAEQDTLLTLDDPIADEAEDELEDEPEDGRREVDVSSEPAIDHPRPSGLVISEVMADPAAGIAGDYNGDGVRGTYTDEYVELRNVGPDTVYPSGWLIGDNDTRLDKLFRIPDSTSVPPGRHITLFGGGEPNGVTGIALADDGRIGDGLSNNGDQVLIVSPDGLDTLDSVSFQRGTEGVSWVRSNDRLVRHNRLPFHGDSSVGTVSPTLVSISIHPEHLTLQKDAEGLAVAMAEFSDGTQDTVSAQINWWVSDTSLVSVAASGWITGLRQGVVDVLGGFGSVVSNSIRVAVLQPADQPEEIAKPKDAEVDSLSLDPPTDRVESSSVTRDEGQDLEPTANGDSVVANLQPSFLSAPVKAAYEGLKYVYDIQVKDPESDPVSIHLVAAPGWMRLDGQVLSGIPGKEDVGEHVIVLAATDGTNQSQRSFQLLVKPSTELFAEPPDSLAQVGLTWRYNLDLDPNLSVQVEGGPHYATNAVVWRPEKEDLGLRFISISVSGIGHEDLLTTFPVMVLGGPELKVSEILVSPPVDVNGDGMIDPFSDQFLEIRNDGDQDLDLSGWMLGDDDGNLFEFPANSILAAGKRLVLTGAGKGNREEGWFSAGGKIGNGLASTDRILLISPNGPDTILSVTYSGGNVRSSLVPDPDKPGKWLPHTSVSHDPISPGIASAQHTTGGPVDGVDTYVLGDLEELDLHGEPPFPNPFSSTTRVSFEGERNGSVRVFNVMGQPVRKLSSVIGSERANTLVWDGRDDSGRRVGSGVYLIRMDNPLESRTLKVVFLRQ